MIKLCVLSTEELESHEKIVIFILVLCSMVVSSCGTKTSTTDLKKMSPKERVIYLHENYYKPLKKNFYDLVSEYEKAKKTNKTIEEFHQATIPLWNKKYGPYIGELYANLPPIENKEIQEIYSYSSILYINLFDDFSNLLSTMSTMSKNQKELRGDINQYNVDFIEPDIQSFEEDDLTYQHQYSKIVNGKGTFELTLNNFSKIKPGMTEMEVSRLLKMPPTFTDLVSLPDHECAYWVLETPDRNSRLIVDVKDLKPSDKYIKLTFKDTNAETDYTLVSKENFGIK